MSLESSAHQGEPASHLRGSSTRDGEFSTSESKTASPANRFGLDYEAEAERLGPPPVPITDVHTHIGGAEAAKIYKRAADLYGILRIYSMTHIEQVETMRDIFGERIRFIAVPDYRAEDKRHSLGRGYIDRIHRYAEHGVKIAKFWAAPRATDYAIEMGDPSLMKLDHPVRIEAMEAARRHGMIFMTHIADPDTWFATKYRDASVYGTKREQYEPFEDLLQRFAQPWIAAHMGGWPEDLAFLTGLMERHQKLYLDTSATKWMVRELSKHSRDELIAFVRRFNGRIMFGSDVVTADEHLQPADEASANEVLRRASSAAEAFDLYASRYWAMRTDTRHNTDYLWRELKASSAVREPAKPLVATIALVPLLLIYVVARITGVLEIEALAIETKRPVASPIGAAEAFPSSASQATALRFRVSNSSAPVSQAYHPFDHLQETPMIFSRRGLCSVAVAVLGAASGLLAQVSPPAPFDPFPGNSAARYHFDLAGNFFSSPAAELARRKELLSGLERLAQISRSLPKSANGILAALALDSHARLKEAVDRLRPGGRNVAGLSRIIHASRLPRGPAPHHHVAGGENARPAEALPLRNRHLCLPIEHGSGCLSPQTWVESERQ
jgi:hypothetical protein